MNKEQLLSIVENDYAVPESIDPNDEVDWILAQFGSVDSELREGSIEVFWQWAQQDVFSASQLRAFGEHLSKNLLIGLGEEETDSVFLRAFSALGLCVLLVMDQVHATSEEAQAPHLLEQETVRRWFDRALLSLRGERDPRGFVPEKGWAHAIAHMADLLGDFARSPHLRGEDLERLLGAIADVFTSPCEIPLLFREDERIANAVMTALCRKELELSFLKEWLHRFRTTPAGGHWADAFGASGNRPRANHAVHNTRSLLRSLYFQLKIGFRSSRAEAFPAFYEHGPHLRDDLLPEVLDTLRAMDKYYYHREVPSG